MNIFLAFLGLAVLVAIAAEPARKSVNYRVVTTLNYPFTIQRKNGTFAGFVFHLLDLVAPLAGFTYITMRVPNGAYGALQPDGSWSGLVGSLINGTNDIAAADLSITSARDAVIDYTTPFGQAPVKILTNVAFGTNNVRYLTIKGLAPVDFLSRSTDPSIQAIWADIQANNGLIDNVQEGVDKVSSGAFALVTDLFGVDKLAKDPSKVKYSDRILASTYLAFAVAQGSPLRDQISIAVSKINEAGQLQPLLARHGLA